jgi:hypothetical protein
MIYRLIDYKIHSWLKRLSGSIRQPEMIITGPILAMLVLFGACSPAAIAPATSQPTSLPLGSSAGQSPAVVWERSGGIAGMCHKLTVNPDGSYLLEDCKAGAQISKGTLPGDQLNTLNDYLRRYTRIQWHTTPGAGSADVFIDQYSLNGNGSQTPSAAEEQSIDEFLANLTGDISNSILSTGSGASGIEGQVSIGPACPGPVSVDKPCPDQPYQATLVVQDQNGQTVTQFQSDANGNFHVSLNPGTYTLHPESAGAYPRARDLTVTVNPGQFTQLQITYDSGIR